VELAERPQVMYNLTVESAQTYFVGAQQWLVHNACPLSATPLAKPGEDLFVGTYNASRYANRQTGLIESHTPHHAIQDALTPLTHGKGITINLDKNLHAMTRTYGKSPPNLAGGLRSHLAADIWDLRGILRAAGYDRAVVNQQLRELIRQNTAAYGL
jgi:hypothetical protein